MNELLEVKVNDENLDSVVRVRLMEILQELQLQNRVAKHYPPDCISFHDHMEQLREYIVDASEYSVAYESIIATLEILPYTVSGAAAVRLLEVGLILGYKTDRPQDKAYDMRE